MTRSGSVVVATLAGLFAALAAQAGTRAWVSGHGTDTAGCGAPTAPCRSLQYAHDTVAVGGEIDVLDPAGYGAVTITKSIRIVNDGVGVAGVQATSGSAITVSATAKDFVVLRGLDIEGVGAATGIHLTAAGSLLVEDCTIDGFTFAGIQFEPASQSYLFVSSTRITNAGTAGVNIRPIIPSAGASVQAMLERVEAVNDNFGIFVDGRQSAQGVTVNGLVSDATITNNASVGVESVSTPTNATTFVLVRNSTIAYGGVGGEADGADLIFGQSTLSGLDTAFVKTGAGLGSYVDNNVTNNATLGSTPATVGFH